MEDCSRIFYGPFACMLLHEPYLWMRNWTPTIENTADLNATNPAFSLAIASRGRDVISSQIDRDAYLMDIGRLPADMRLVPTSENDRLELPNTNALLRMNRETLEAARVKLEILIREVHTHGEIFGRGMMNLVVLYDSKTTPNEGIPYIQLPLQAMGKKLGALRDTLAAQLEHTIRILSLHGPPLDPRRGESTGTLPQTPPSFVSGGGQMTHLSALPRQLDIPGNSAGNEEPWRPQRGLPERAVLTLRNWLFENFLHPYPKDSDKQLLARRTGLSRNQVSNWFINARVRLWKPMVEDMCEIDPEDDGMQAIDAGHGNAVNSEATGSHLVPPSDLAGQFERDQGDNYPVTTSPTGFLVPHSASAGTEVGLFQGLNPGSQSRLSWRAEMEQDMQTWITIASGAQHEHNAIAPVTHANSFNMSQHHLANPAGNSGAITIPLELGLSEPRNQFEFFGEGGRAQNLAAHLGNTIHMTGPNQGPAASNLFLALDSQRAANMFGSSTLGYTWNHQQSVTLSLSNPENFQNLGLPLGAAFPGFSTSSGYAQDLNDPSAAAGVSLTLGLQLRNSDLPAAVPETTMSLPLLDNFNSGFAYNAEMPPGAEQ